MKCWIGCTKNATTVLCTQGLSVLKVTGNYYIEYFYFFSIIISKEKGHKVKTPIKMKLKR